MKAKRMTPSERRDEVRELVARSGLSHREIGERMGVHRVTVSRWMNGSITIPQSRLNHLRLHLWQRLGEGLRDGPDRGMDRCEVMRGG